MTKENILDYLNRNKDYIKYKYGITKIGLLGSYAREEENSQSDIDIVIEIDKSRKNIHTFFAFKRELEAVFGKKIDLGLESSIKPIAEEVIQKEIVYV
ncbi:MAG: nucleotidyltransferase family protein [Dissulfuribacterales bacterium]